MMNGNIERFIVFLQEIRAELEKTGMSEKTVTLLLQDEELLEDVKLYMDEDPDMTGADYARMILNQWSGVQRREIRENMKAKLVNEMHSESMEEHFIDKVIEELQDRGYTFEEAEMAMEEVEELVREKSYDAAHTPGMLGSICDHIEKVVLKKY